MKDNVNMVLAFMLGVGFTLIGVGVYMKKKLISNGRDFEVGVAIWLMMHEGLSKEDLKERGWEEDIIEEASIFVNDMTDVCDGDDELIKAVADSHLVNYDATLEPADVIKEAKIKLKGKV